MTDKNPSLVSQKDSFCSEETNSTLTNPVQEFIQFPQSLPLLPAEASNQRIEIVFAQGHRLCLQGSFDLDSLKTLLTPLLAKNN